MFARQALSLTRRLSRFPFSLSVSWLLMGKTICRRRATYVYTYTPVKFAPLSRLPGTDATVLNDPTQ